VIQSRENSVENVDHDNTETIPDGSPTKAEEPAKEKKKKMIITGDDILIEYVQRIIRVMENILVVYQTKCDTKVDRVDEIIP